MVVADVYDPMHLEQLEQGHDAEGERGRFDAVRNASARPQRAAGAGRLHAVRQRQAARPLARAAGRRSGRINPVTYDGDESLRSLLAVVPFGVGDEPPEATRPAIRGVVPGIGPDDQVILWGGGVYNWFDPLTLVRAVDRLRQRLPTVRLLFLGHAAPQPRASPRCGWPSRPSAWPTSSAWSARTCSSTEDWVAFEDRQNFLLDADVGVSTHLDHIETEFSFRTRILDYLWAGLPDRRHRRRLLRRRDRSARTSASWCRPATSTPSRTPWLASSATRPWPRRAS